MSLTGIDQVHPSTLAKRKKKKLRRRAVMLFLYAFVAP